MLNRRHVTWGTIWNAILLHRLLVYIQQQGVFFMARRALAPPLLIEHIFQMGKNVALNNAGVRNIFKNEIAFAASRFNFYIAKVENGVNKPGRKGIDVLDVAQQRLFTTLAKAKRPSVNIHNEPISKLEHIVAPIFYPPNYP